MAGDTIATKQITYQTNMMTLLDEMGGSRIVKYCEAAMNVEGEKHTFYRISQSGTLASINAYVASPTTSGGDTSKLEVSPTLKYAMEVLTELELKQTKLDLKSTFNQSLIRALEREQDATILTAIDNNINVATAGDATKSISDPDQFKLFSQTIAYAKALAKGNPDHGLNCAVVLSREDYGALFGAEWFVNGDYSKVVNGISTINGAELIVSDQATPGDVYIIPNMTVCFAAFKGGDKAVMEYLNGTDQWQVMARKSFGADLFDTEAPYITKFATNGLNVNNV